MKPPVGQVSLAGERYHVDVWSGLVMIFSFFAICWYLFIYPQGFAQPRHRAAATCFVVEEVGLCCSRTLIFGLLLEFWFTLLCLRCD